MSRVAVSPGLSPNGTVTGVSSSGDSGSGSGSGSGSAVGVSSTSGSGSAFFLGGIVTSLQVDLDSRDVTVDGSHVDAFGEHKLVVVGGVERIVDAEVAAPQHHLSADVQPGFAGGRVGAVRGLVEAVVAAPRRDLGAEPGPQHVAVGL